MSNFANPELENSFLKIILASNTPAAPAVVFANDLTKGLYWDINGLHLTGLPASPTDNTEAASKAYVDAQAGGGGATTALDNLASVAVNDNLLPGVSNSIDLGSAGQTWQNVFVGSAIKLDSDADIEFGVSGGVLSYDTGTTAFTINTALLPDTSQAYDLGSDTLLFNNAYLTTVIGPGPLNLYPNKAAFDDTSYTLLLDASGNHAIFGGDSPLAIADVNFPGPSFAFNFDGSVWTLQGNQSNIQLDAQAGGFINLHIYTTDAAQFDDSSTAGETRFMLWDVDSGALQRVTVGAADSGGTGFKVLRIPN